MTVITKSNLMSNKQPDVVKVPLEVEHVITGEIEFRANEAASASLRRIRVTCVTLGIITVVLSSILSGTVLYKHYLKTQRPPHFQGFCSVPVDNRPEPRQLDFRATPMQTPEPEEVEMMGAIDEERINKEIVRFLSEELDIGDTIEKIYVGGGLGKLINFVHDWTANVSGIIEENRCFVMDMNPEVVLPPPLFVLSIEQGGQFEVSRVRSALTAAMPPLTDLSHLGSYIQQLCNTRPTYRLEQIDTIVRKRSVDDSKVAPDFIHFSGKHIHEIEIDNMVDVVQAEQQASAI